MLQNCPGIKPITRRNILCYTKLDYHQAHFIACCLLTTSYISCWMGAVCLHRGADGRVSVGRQSCVELGDETACCRGKPGTVLTEEQPTANNMSKDKLVTTCDHRNKILHVYCTLLHGSVNRQLFADILTHSCPPIKNDPIGISFSNLL